MFYVSMGIDSQLCNVVPLNSLELLYNVVLLFAFPRAWQFRCRLYYYWHSYWFSWYYCSFPILKQFPCNGPI